jgi:predicted PurR-regulated permease PerM
LILNVLPDDVAQQVIQKALASMPQLLSGIGSVVFSSFSSIFAFDSWASMCVFLLYYLLADWHNLSDWVGRHLGASDELGIEIANDSTSAVRTYFYALTLANIPVAASVGLTMWLLVCHWRLPVAIVTLITCYVPYLGASFSALFAGWSLLEPVVFGKRRSWSPLSYLCRT